MKKIIFLLMVFCAFLSIPTNKAFADDEKTYFAKVETSEAMLYSSPNDQSALFEIPYSYFVKVESVVDNFFKVTYKDVSGFVKKSQVTLMNGDPINPYFQATIQNYLEFSLYDSPNRNGKILTLLPENATLNYYGTKVGQALTTKTSDWIYCSYINSEKTFYGYIYSEIASQLPVIQTNLETFDIVDEKVLSNITPVEFSKLSTGTKVLLIISISVPSVLILYFLIKPTKITQITKNRKKVRAENKKIHHGDYFEFDESQL